jgi:uncharacterized protein (DUF362 family)
MPDAHPNPGFQAGHSNWTRRQFLKAAACGGAAAAIGYPLARAVWPVSEPSAATFIAAIPGYQQDLRTPILQGLRELAFSSTSVRGKRVLLKPNLVEPHRHAAHINTHPLIIQAAAEAFLVLGAASVTVAEGAGHRRDAYMVLEESGLADALYEDRIPFVDLNNADVSRVPNRGGRSRLGELYLPQDVLAADLVVSIAKMKTHHWVGATLSMKNLFGVMPGSVYGWPKNVLHWAGITQAILDITATVRPTLAIVDGIVGMEGDGPIMGTPVASHVLVMGANPPAVDATCARIMGINPLKIDYLKAASGWLGTVREKNIQQRGEQLASVRRDFRLMDSIPAQAGLRAG